MKIYKGERRIYGGAGRNSHWMQVSICRVQEAVAQVERGYIMKFPART